MLNSQPAVLSSRCCCSSVWNAYQGQSHIFTTLFDSDVRWTQVWCVSLMRHLCAWRTQDVAVHQPVDHDALQLTQRHHLPLRYNRILTRFS